MTICVNCRHHRNTHDGSNYGPPSDTWFYQVCDAPAVQKQEAIDPVSGKVGYTGTNDLGGKYLDDDSRPNCRDINDGACPHFREKVANRLGWFWQSRN